MKDRPPPSLVIAVHFENGRPELRFLAYSDRDLERLKLWLRATPVLCEVAEAALVLLADLLAEENAA